MQTKLYALDSSFIINFLQGDEKARNFYQRVNSGKLIIPSPVLMETLRGVEEIGKFRELENRNFGEAEAEEALKIIEHLEEKGDMIGLLDIMIAAIASKNNAEIITYDGDFQKLKEYGLEIAKVN